MRSALDADPTAGLAASCIVYLNDPATVDSAGDGITRYGGAFKRGHGRPVAEAREPREVFGACGAACVIRRGLFDEIGGFDEAYFAVHEDVDLSYRSQLLGYRCLYCPHAIVHHAGSATMGHLSQRAVFWGQRNLEWTYVKNTPAPLLARTLISHLAYNAASAAYFARCGLLGVFVKAKIAAIRGLPAVLKKRAAVQRTRTAPASAIEQHLDRRWFSAKVREKRFDLGLAQVR